MKPNLLFIYTDEQACNTLAAYGNTRIAMPNLNRLAERSVVFEQAYVTQPVCTPSRSTLLTGLYPHTNGCVANNIPLRPDTPCFPELLPKGDYIAGHFGKWHLGDEVFAQHGFDEWVSVEDAYRGYYREGRDRNVRSNYHHFLAANGFAPVNGSVFGRGEAARLPEAHGKPAFLAREASRFIRRHRARPFILYVNFLEPHMPYFSPRDGQYDAAQMPLPANHHAIPTAAQPLKARLMREFYRRHGHSGLSLRDESEWRRMIAGYWGLCSLVDTHVGTILEALDECALRDNTIVVFTSDHGDMMGSHELLAKCVMFEEAVRVPLMISLPALTRAKRVTGPVSQIDVMPTLLDLLGRPPPGHLQGTSLRPLMETRAPRSRASVCIEWNGSETGMGRLDAEPVPDWMTAVADAARIRAACADPVRTIVAPDGWKFNCSPLGEHELYRLDEDPGETRNVFDQERHQPRVRRLWRELRDWQVRTGDAVRLPEIT